VDLLHQILKPPSLHDYERQIQNVRLRGFATHRASVKAGSAELRETISDDEGITWTPSKPRVFANLDVYRTSLWVDQFHRFKFRGKFLDETDSDDLRVAVVDPDLIELRSGVLVAASGVRSPH
jgi:hypothetical protein